MLIHLVTQGAKLAASKCQWSWWQPLRRISCSSLWKGTPSTTRQGSMQLHPAASPRRQVATSPSPGGLGGPPRGCRLGGSWLTHLSLRNRGRPSSPSPAPKQLLAKGRGKPPTGPSAASAPKLRSPRSRAARLGRHTLRSKRARLRAG